jgi:hypothetical protein
MTNSSEQTMQYDQIGSDARHLKFLREDEIAAFQGLFLLAPKKHEKLIYRLSTGQTSILLRMTRDLVLVVPPFLVVKMANKVDWSKTSKK